MEVPGFRIITRRESRLDVATVRRIVCDLPPGRTVEDVLLDLPQVAQVDEGAVRVLVVLIRRHVNRGGEFYVCCANGEARQRLVELRVGRVATAIFASQEDFERSGRDTLPIGQH